MLGLLNNDLFSLILHTLNFRLMNCITVDILASVRNPIIYISVHSSVITEYTTICYVSPVQFHDSFVVCGQREREWELVRYKLKTGTILDRVVLRTAPEHAQEVFFNADLTISVSYK